MLCFTLADKLAAALVVEIMRPPDLPKPATCRASETLNAAIIPYPEKKTKKRRRRK